MKQTREEREERAKKAQTALAIKLGQATGIDTEYVQRWLKGYDLYSILNMLNYIEKGIGGNDGRKASQRLTEVYNFLRAFDGKVQGKFAVLQRVLKKHPSALNAIEKGGLLSPELMREVLIKPHEREERYPTLKSIETPTDYVQPWWAK